jgi:ABC-type Fe3+-siderophore transport system permease subunit
MSRWVDPHSRVVPAARLVASLVVGLLLAAIGGMVLGEYTFQGEGIQWLAISGGAGLGAAMAWVLNRVWAHDPPLWVAPVGAVLAMVGEALAVQRDNPDRAWPPEGWVAIGLAGIACAYGVYSARKVAAEERAKKS